VELDQKTYRSIVKTKLKYGMMFDPGFLQQLN
jgi:hypothetical protein